MDDLYTPEDKQLALSQGLLGLGAGLLSGSYGHYGAFAPALSSGATGFQQGYQSSMDNALKVRQWRQNQLLQNAQIQNYQSEIAKRTAEEAEKERIRKLSLGADGFASGAGPTTSPGPMVPAPVGVPMLMPSGPGASALAGGAGVVGGGAGYGATGSPVPGAASSIPVGSPPPAVAPNGDQVLPTVNVTGKPVSNLLNPDWHMARAEYLYKNGDAKGAVEAVTRAQQLRAEERTMTKDDQRKPLEGVPGIEFEPKSGKYYEDGKEVPAAHVQEVKRGLAKAGATQVTTNLSTEKKYGEAFAGKVAESDSGLRDAAIKAPEMAQRANQIRELIASGKVITGAGADFRLALGKAMNLVGASDKETISNTEGLFADLASTTLDSIKTSGLGSGQGFTNTDRDFLEKAKAGKISLESSTLNRLAELNHKAAVATATKWNDRVKMIPDSALVGTGLTKEPIQVPPLYGANKMGPKTMLSPTEKQELDALRKRFNK